MFKKMLISATCFALIACGGGGGNGGGAPGFTHNQLAENFVQNLNASGQMHVTLVKDSTLQRDFIVVYNPSTDEYVAINIDLYQPNGDALAFYQANQAGHYYDLDVIPGYYETHTRTSYDAWCECYTTEEYETWVPQRYRDRRADITFEKITASPKDLEKMAALKEAVQMGQVSEKLQAQFGLSAERSNEVARLTNAWSKAGGKDLTAKEHDAFSKEVLGFTITEGQSAFQSGNESSINSLIEKAAVTNGTSPENVREIIKGFMN